VKRRHIVRQPGRGPSLSDEIKASERDGIICSYLELLDCPRALTVWLLYKDKQSSSHSQIVDINCDPLMYDDPDSFCRDYRATKFLSKYIDLNLDVDRSDVAIRTASWAEVQNLKTNLRLDALGVNPAMDPILFRAQNFIASVLGPVPDSFVDTGWSKGRTTAASGPRLSSVMKYASRLDSTVSSVDRAVKLLNDSPLWAASVLNADAACNILPRALHIVEGNVMITVPKNAKTDRVICYEPHLNVRLQLQVGKYIRRRLQRFGVNLDDQSVNQIRAHRGSLSGDLSTVDLKSASDTLSFSLVEQLLPPDWMALLDDLRSKKTLWPDGTLRTNQKFSSMGNGFTFELESLIFASLCSSVCHSDWSVYGDDLVIPTWYFDDLKRVLEYCGFTLNTSKSFSKGWFRESCGSDYFRGLFCTPVYLKNLKTLEDVIKLHNQIRDKFSRDGMISRPVSDLLRSWRDMRPYHLGPSDFGDGHYHTNFDEACPTRASHSIDGWWFTSSLRVFRSGVGLVREISQSGHTQICVPSQLGYASLCASLDFDLGSVLERSLEDLFFDRRFFAYKNRRVLSNFCWRGEKIVI